MIKGHSIFRFVLAAVVAVAFSLAALAQDGKGFITGRVVTERGKAIADARVIATGSSDTEVKTDIKGEFRIELDPGSYRLRFEADGYASTTLRLPVEVAAGHTAKVEKRVEMTEADDDTVIRGSVFDLAGRTIAGAKVTLERVPGADGAEVKKMRLEARSDSMGFFVFRVKGGEGRYRMTAVTDKHAPGIVTVDVSGGEILNAPPITLSPR